VWQRDQEERKRGPSIQRTRDDKREQCRTQRLPDKLAA